MEDMSLIDIGLRFFLGGGSVAMAFLLGRRVGGRFGGFFAAFPGVYLASIIAVGIVPSVQSGNRLILQISQGALIGMAINILTCLAAGWLIPKAGYLKGLLLSLLIWLVAGSCIITIVQLAKGGGA